MAEENIFSDLLDDELDQSEDNGRDNLNPSNGNRYEHWRIIVDDGQAPVRIDKFLAEHMQHSSRNRIQTAADAGCICVAGKAVKSNYKVRPEMSSRSCSTIPNTTQVSWRRTFHSTSSMRMTT